MIQCCVLCAVCMLFSIHFQNINTTRHENKLKSLRPRLRSFKTFNKYDQKQQCKMSPTIAFFSALHFVFFFASISNQHTAPNCYAFKYINQKTRSAAESGPWTIDGAQRATGKADTTVTHTHAHTHKVWNNNKEDQRMADEPRRGNSIGVPSAPCKKIK